MPSRDHVHTYIKYKKRQGYWRCLDPHCTRIVEGELVLGKATLCPFCGTEFILDREAMRRARPRCLNCSETRKAKEFRAAKALMDGLIPSLSGLGEGQNQEEEDY